MPATACAGDGVQNACKMFYSELKPVPHAKLSVNTGLLSSLSDGKKFHGCEVVFNSNEQLMRGQICRPLSRPKTRCFIGRDGGLMRVTGQTLLDQAHMG